MILHPHFPFKSFPEKEREGEREERAQIRERERERREPRSRRSSIDERRDRDRRSRHLSDDRTALTSDAIDDGTARRSSLIAPLVAPRPHRSSLVIDSFSFAGFWFLLPDLMHFL